jgi:ABC-type transport system substrate-binding protein
MATRIVMMLLGLTLVLAVACGSAAEPTAVPDPTATQAAGTAPAAETTAAPVESDTSQPTAVPQVADSPADVEVNPGKLTIMVGYLGNERFNYGFHAGGGGSSQTYARILHGFLISDNERKEMVPGIASQWGFSPDGLTWTFTIREGVKFHDGSELTPEDVLGASSITLAPRPRSTAPLTLR